MNWIFIQIWRGPFSALSTPISATKYSFVSICNQILILQHFSRSIRLTFLCTAQNSKFSDFFINFRKFPWIFKIFAELENWTSLIFMIFALIFTKFCRNCGKSEIIAGSQCSFQKMSCIVVRWIFAVILSRKFFSRQFSLLRFTLPGGLPVARGETEVRHPQWR